MHRQSLGSPASKLHNNGGIVSKDENLIVEDQKRKNQSSSLPIDDANDSDNNKSQKKPHQKSPPRPERLVHIIPILTLLCFLILFLSSHSPSQTDLAQFNDFKRLSKPIDSNAIDDFEEFTEMKKGDVLAIRSLRNLQEIGSEDSRYRLHRKIGDF